jgi:phosphatidylethanolamine/phosphatidyl-N-methylethanolamine N-methyltransferase
MTNPKAEPPKTGPRKVDILKPEIDKATIEKAYARWAPIYDVVFGAVFDPGRQAAIIAAEAKGGRILDVGVGTGLSLPDYAPSSRVFGVDLSEPMLRKAYERVRALDLCQVDGLAVMDAQRLAFADGSFDVVVAQFVITAVPNPEATLDEFARVVRPGGEIILVNHLGAESGFRYVFEQVFAPLARRLGWRPEFRWERIARWADRFGDVTLIERREIRPLGHFSLIRFHRGRQAMLARA